MLIYYESGKNTFVTESIMNSHNKITDLNKSVCVHKPLTPYYPKAFLAVCRVQLKIK